MRELAHVFLMQEAVQFVQGAFAKRSIWESLHPSDCGILVSGGPLVEDGDRGIRLNFAG